MSQNILDLIDNAIASGGDEMRWMPGKTSLRREPTPEEIEALQRTLAAQWEQFAGGMQALWAAIAAPFAHFIEVINRYGILPAAMDPPPARLVAFRRKARIRGR